MHKDIHSAITSIVNPYSSVWSEEECVHFLKQYTGSVWVITSYKKICDMHKEVVENQLQGLISPVFWIRNWARASLAAESILRSAGRHALTELSRDTLLFKALMSTLDIKCSHMDAALLAMTSANKGRGGW